MSSVWNHWPQPLGLVTGPAPTKGLIYAKASAKPPFPILSKSGGRY
jgi:hypothetical protein